MNNCIELTLETTLQWCFAYFIRTSPFVFGGCEENTPYTFLLNVFLLSSSLGTISFSRNNRWHRCWRAGCSVAAVVDGKVGIEDRLAGI
jgi:hypothetical protein